MQKGDEKVHSISISVLNTPLPPNDVTTYDFIQLNRDIKNTTQFYTPSSASQCTNVNFLVLKFLNKVFKNCQFCVMTNLEAKFLLHVLLSYLLELDFYIKKMG